MPRRSAQRCSVWHHVGSWCAMHTPPLHLSWSNLANAMTFMGGAHDARRDSAHPRCEGGGEVAVPRARPLEARMPAELPAFNIKPLDKLRARSLHRHAPPHGRHRNVARRPANGPANSSSAPSANWQAVRPSRRMARCARCLLQQPEGQNRAGTRPIDKTRMFRALAA